MLLQKLHNSYSAFAEYCGGVPGALNVTFEEICDRLRMFNEINGELIRYESEYAFSDESEEVLYFKHEKSEFQKFGMYYEMIYHIELKKRPLACRYYKKLLKRIDKEFGDIEPYVIYYRSDSTDRDSEYFRKKSDKNHIISLVKAHDMLVKYLSQKSGGKTADEIIAKSPEVKFNLRQNDIMELAKGLKGISAAEGTLKEVAESLGRFFGVDMKNVHSKSHVISHRLNPSRFLDKMAHYLKKNI